MLRFPSQPDKDKTTFSGGSPLCRNCFRHAAFRRNFFRQASPLLARCFIVGVLFFTATAVPFTGRTASAQTHFQNRHTNFPDTLNRGTQEKAAFLQDHHSDLRDSLLIPSEEPRPVPRQIPLKQHLLGIRGGYAFNTVHFNPDRKQKSVPSWINASLLYTYYHHLWGNLPYFGVQTGFTYTQQAYDTPEQKRIYEVLRVPLTSQFHVDMWKTRLLVNLGCFAGYRMSATDYTEELPQGVPVTFDCNHIYADYGFQGGLGFALVLKPFEFQIEANYLYSLSMIENPALYSNEYYTYGYPGQLLITFGIFIHLHK